MLKNQDITVFVIGKMVPENLRYYMDLGYKLVFLADGEINSEVAKKEFYTETSGLSFYEVDYSSKLHFLESISVANIKEKPDVLVTFFENYVLAKTWLGEIYGIDTSNEETALSVTDKHTMRQKFMQNFPEITPDFEVVNTPEDLIRFAEAHTFPLMLKPANLFKSLLITKNNNLDELLQNYEIMKSEIEEIYKKNHVRSREAKIIVEECLIGTFHSVEVFAGKDGEVTSVEEPVDLVFAPSLGVNDNYNYSRKLPSALSDSSKQELIQAAKKAAKALNLIASPGHVELVMTNTGAKVIEIGARLGGYRSRMHYLASGINLIEAEVRCNLGDSFDLTHKVQGYCAVYEFFPEDRGELVEIENIVEIDKLESFYYKSVKALPGAKVGLASQGFRAAAVLFLTNSDKEQFEADCQFVEQNVRVIVNSL